MRRAEDRPGRKEVPLLERKDLPERDRARIGLAVSGLLAVGLATIAAIGALMIWHLVRRGRLIRGRLASPRTATLPEVAPIPKDRLTPPER